MTRKLFYSLFLFLFSISSSTAQHLYPTDAPAVGLVPAPSAAAEGSHIFKAAPGNLYAYQVTTGASAGYVMIFTGGLLTGGTC